MQLLRRKRLFPLLQTKEQRDPPEKPAHGVTYLPGVRFAPGRTQESAPEDEVPS